MKDLLKDLKFIKYLIKNFGWNYAKGLVGMASKTFNRTLSFYKTADNKWYLDIPAWPLDVSYLEMVCGTDQMLDYLAGDENEIDLTVSNSAPVEFKGVLVENPSENLCSGMYYKFSTPDKEIENYDLWLCYVTKLIFGHFPKKIYIK